MFALDGSVIKRQGVWLMVDGGYQSRGTLITNKKWATSIDWLSWGEWLESSRKSIECVFGRLKGRFRSLKLPSLFHTAERVTHVVSAAAVLHNRCMYYDGMDEQYDDEVDDYLGVAGQFAVDETGKYISNGQETRVQRAHALRVGAETDVSNIGAAGNPDVPDTCSTPADAAAFEQRQQELMEHFTVAKRKGLVHWLGQKDK